MKNEESSGWIVTWVIVAIVVVAVIGLSILGDVRDNIKSYTDNQIQAYKNDLQTRFKTCNHGILSNDVVSADEGSMFFGIDFTSDSKTTIADVMSSAHQVNESLKRTDKEVNIMNKLMACYFDQI